MYHWKPAPIEPLGRSEGSRLKPALRRWTSFNVNPVLLCCSLISAYRANGRKTLAGSEDQGAGPSAGVIALQLMYGDRLGTFPADLRWALF